MKTKVAITIAAAWAVSAFAQLPGKPEENGLNPISDTFFVNTPDTILNNNTESLGIAIARNGNVIIGWEDDGDVSGPEPLKYIAATWTLFDSTGKSITPDTEITSLAFPGQTLTTKFLSYFRKDGTATPAFLGWGPKIKANLFGDGIGMGSNTDNAEVDLGVEVVEFAPYNEDGGFPGVQLLSNAGAPVGIVAGVTAAYSQTAPNAIRIGDWDYLSTGRVLIVGESRQNQDLVDLYGGAEPQEHVIFRIVDSAGAEVKAATLVSSEATKANMWHGSGVTKNGFAIRFDSAGAKVRLFKNDGTPEGANIDLATLSGSPIMGMGGRGDGVGFHGNGNDAYAAVAKGPGEAGPEVWVTVLNANGTLRWAKNVSDDLTLVNPDRCDVGIDVLGRVVVVYDDSVSTGGNARQIIGRAFSAQGTPLGGSFYISEVELPDPATLESRRARVAFRNDTIAITWESKNSGVTEESVVAARLFVIPVKPGSIESVGLTRIVPDTVVINQDAPSLGNWEPYASVLGTSTFLIEGNAYAENFVLPAPDGRQRYVVAFQPAAGGPMKLGEGFFADNGTPYKGEINISRNNGNPGRVAGDKRPGAVNFITGGETGAHLFDPFKSDNRWNLGFDRLVDGRYGTVQTFKLDTATLAQTSLSKAQDSANGRLTSGAAANNQISRFGGELAALDNGNFVSVIDERSQVRDPANITVATIFAPDGSVVKDTWVVDPRDTWSNLAAYKGGFAVRVHDTIYFYNNAGDLQGSVVHNTSSGENYNTDRGDGTRIAAHINSPYVFLAGKVTDAPIVRVSAWDARTREFFATAEVSEGGFRGDFNRAVVTSDALNRLVVAWVVRPEGYEADQVAARVLALEENPKAIKPLTASFFPFINTAPVGGIRTFQMSVAMTTKQILVAAKGEINLANKPDQSADSPSEINFYTVFSHPNPADDPTTPVGGGGGAVVVGIGTVDPVGQTVTLSWSGGTGPFLVQGKMNITGGWTDLVTTADRSAKIPLVGGGMFLRVQDGATKTVKLFKAVLNGANERPNPVVTPATGVGLLALDGTTATYAVSYSGLTAVTSAAHVHGPGSVDQAVGVFFAISGPLGATAGLFSGVQAGLAPATITAIENGQSYFNIHTVGPNSGGEIRGQLLAP